MKAKLHLSVIALLTLLACGRDEVSQNSRSPEGIFHGMIELGEKLDDPYTTANMQAALEVVYPTKAGRSQISTTDLYVRFLPSSDAQLQQLRQMDVYLLDHPMDYRILREGDYYQDPSLGSEAITWQYGVVPKDFSFPDGIRYEILDECYLADHDPSTKADGLDWEAIEEAAFRLTGNEDLLVPRTKGESAAPQGRITIEDPDFSGGKPFGVAGVKVACNIFVKIATCYTTRDGYYEMTKKFSGKPRYRLVFQNEKGFSIGFNWIIIPASVSTLGQGEATGIDYHITAESDGALFRRCVVNNAAYDYYNRCTATDLDIPEPPSGIRFWIFPDIAASSCNMLHHGAFMDNNLLQKYLGQYLSLIKVFLPDITIGTKDNNTYATIYSNVSHELSHASHYTQVGNGYWSPYIGYVLDSFVTQGGKAYGDGTGDNAGYCEIGEMWGYFMEASLFKDRYGGSINYYGNSFWFKPDIFSYLYERGMSRGEIFRALQADVTTRELLKTRLMSLYPGMETTIQQTFSRYGK